MKTYGAPILAALAAPGAVVLQLILLAFPVAGFPADHSRWIALNTSTMDVVFGGVTYKGAAGLGTISPIIDAAGEVKGLQFEMSGVAASSVSLALDGTDEWQGCPVTILTAILDSSTYAVIDAGTEWTGLGDTMSIQEDGETCTISASAESSAVDLLRGVPTTYTDADQQILHPGDTAFQYVNQQADQPVIWPDKAFFRR